MPAKKENLPVNVDVDLQEGGTITYANEVIAIIAGVATNEIEGIAGMCTSGGLADILGRNRNITRGVKVEIGTEEASVDLYVIIEYGQPIQKVAQEVQENVRKAIETMTGLHVVRVDVHVQGVSFEKEKRETQTSLESAAMPVIESAPAVEPEKHYKVEIVETAEDEVPADAPVTTDAEPTDTEPAEPIEAEPAEPAQAEPATEAPAEEPIACDAADEPAPLAADADVAFEASPEKPRRTRKPKA